MFAFTYVWPYMGLGAALLLALLLCTDALRSDLTVSRGRDLGVARLGGHAGPYLIHQFEEHGVDALGATYAFRTEMCRNFGFPDVQACPIPFSFVTADQRRLAVRPDDSAARTAEAELALAFFPCPSSTPSCTSARQRPAGLQRGPVDRDCDLPAAVVVGFPCRPLALPAGLARRHRHHRRRRHLSCDHDRYGRRLRRRPPGRARARRDPGRQSGSHPPHRGAAGTPATGPSGSVRPATAVATRSARAGQSCRVAVSQRKAWP